MHEQPARSAMLEMAGPGQVALEYALREIRKDHREPAQGFNPLAPTIFHEEWWLEAATGGHFGAAEVRAGGRVVGRLPFHKTKRFGLAMIRMPELTHFLGPAIDEGEGTPNTRFLKRLQITRELLERLPRASWQYVKCHRGVTEAIAFQDLGFRTYVQFTHEIAPQPPSVLWEQRRNKTRNVIRRAEERFSVTELADPCEFLRFYERNLDLTVQASGLDGRLCREILSESLDRKRGRILAARDRNHQIVAANFYVWDEMSSFYLLSMRSQGFCNGAITLLIWEAIKESARRGLIFDFAGLGNRGSILLYSGFGACVSARYVALRARPLARMINGLKLLVIPENCFY
jgi:Acetyltransferase (GNAT) domain